MPFPATVYSVFIASPGDVQEERQIVREVVFDWNSAHVKSTKAILYPIGWETDAYPDTGGHPQAIINRQLVADADVLVAIFWARVGTTTPEAPSGTVEEINRHVSSGKPAMIYFSGRDPKPDVDLDQLKGVRELKKKFQSEALFDTFKSLEEFRQKFSRQLAKRMSEHLESNAPATTSGYPTPPLRVSALSRLDTSVASEAVRLLQEAARSQSREILRRNVLGGFQISANRKDFINDGERRTQARWKAALDELERQQFVEAVGTSGPSGQIYRVTHAGDVVLGDLTEEAKARFTRQNEIFVNVEIVFTTHPNKPQFNFVVRLPQSTVENDHIEWNMDYLPLHEVFRARVTHYALMCLNFADFGALPYNSDVSFFLGDARSLPKNPEQKPGNCWVWRL